MKQIRVREMDNVEDILGYFHDAWVKLSAISSDVEGRELRFPAVILLMSGETQVFFEKALLTRRVRGVRKYPCVRGAFTIYDVSSFQVEDNRRANLVSVNEITRKGQEYSLSFEPGAVVRVVSPTVDMELHISDDVVKWEKLPGRWFHTWTMSMSEKEFDGAP